MSTSAYPLAPFWSLATFKNKKTQSFGEVVHLERIESSTGKLIDVKLLEDEANSEDQEKKDTENTSEGKAFRAGDVLFGKLRPYLSKSWLANKEGTALGDIHVYQPNEDCDSRFLSYLVLSNEFVGLADASSTGTKMPRTEWSKISQFKVPAPPRTAQCAIADYLDHETREIDGMHADLGEMERLLIERRRNIVKSIFSELRESGCSYRKLGYVAQFRNGQDTKGIEDASGDYPVYGSGGVFKRANSFLFDGPSVLFGRKGTLDKPLLVDGKFWTVDTMYYTILSQDIFPSFLHQWATTIPFEKHSTNTALPSMTSTVLSQLRVPVPPLSEQRRIADEIDRETAEIDSMLEDITKLRDLLTERRAAVISAAVTGQIDVPISPSIKDKSHV